MFGRRRGQDQIVRHVPLRRSSLHARTHREWCGIALWSHSRARLEGPDRPAERVRAPPGHL